jgi:hypothetical protein
MEVFDSRRVASAIGLALSVLLALSLWMSLGLTTKSALSVPGGPELTRSDQPEDSQPVRLAADLELKEDHEGSDSPLADDVCVEREILTFAPTLVCQAWRAEVRSLVSQRIREGHGARGPPQA